MSPTAMADRTHRQPWAMTILVVLGLHLFHALWRFYEIDNLAASEIGTIIGFSQVALRHRFAVYSLMSFFSVILNSFPRL